jgi:hypothetical protein
MTDLPEFSEWALSEADWLVLEGLETVLSVSHILTHAWTVLMR